MLGPLDYAIWLVTAVLQAGVVVCSIKARCFFKYFPLNFYMIVACVLTGGRYLVLTKYGYHSVQYFYFYYYSDLLLTICLFFALMGLFAHVFQEMGANWYVRIGSMSVLGLTALISYAMVREAQDRMMGHFVAELSQNLNFVVVVLTYLLWGAILKLHKTGTRLVQLVLALGVYVSAFSASYALSVLYPDLWVWKLVSHFMAIWLPLAWAYTFLKIPEEARLHTARLTASQR